MRKRAQKIQALLGENGFAYSDFIKAETIALSLEKQFSLNNLSHRETENEVKKSTENFSSLPLTNNQIDNLKCIQPSEKETNPLLRLWIRISDSESEHEAAESVNPIRQIHKSESTDSFLLADLFFLVGIGSFVPFQEPDPRIRSGVNDTSLL
ncbi:hypothetical protein AVEN_214638-1 [Araneus ventricosus]|uniref:Uncharacterized protein n=1 Tax=Araneus ventricosus TaxID=182803 RepID=A0A4Y2LBE4_ARAVE|nr:hypothetical protein AVEN_214638-1 [Araneus ventricosus]